jgi:hypothetical protein
MTITIRPGRDASLDAARALALAVATEVVGAKSVIGCFLTKVEGTAVTLELRLTTPAGMDRDTLQSTLLGSLSERFAGAHIGAPGGDTPAFS